MELHEYLQEYLKRNSELKNSEILGDKENISTLLVAVKLQKPQPFSVSLNPGEKIKTFAALNRLVDDVSPAITIARINITLSESASLNLEKRWGFYCSGQMMFQEIASLHHHLSRYWTERIQSFETLQHLFHHW